MQHVSRISTCTTAFQMLECASPMLQATDCAVVSDPTTTSLASLRCSCPTNHSHLSNHPHHIKELVPLRSLTILIPSRFACQGGLEIVCNSSMRHQTHARTETAHPNKLQTSRWHSIRPNHAMTTNDSSVQPSYLQKSSLPQPYV